MLFQRNLNTKLYLIVIILMTKKKNIVLFSLFALIGHWGIASKIESVSIFRDQGYQHQIDQLSDDWFIPTGQENINLGYSKDIIWLKISLDTEIDCESKYLHFTKPTHDSLTVFQQKDGEWLVFNAGISTKDSIFTSHSGYYFPIDSKEIYVRSKSVYTQDLNFQIVDYQARIDNENRIRLIFGILIGSILTIVLYNLFLGLRINDSTYFFYALTGLSSLAGQLSLMGFFNSYELVDMILIKQILLPICVTSVKITGAIFSIKFLELGKYNNTARKIVLFVIAFNVAQLTACLVLNVVGIITLYRLGAVGGVLFVISAIYATFAAMKAGNKNAKYYLIAGVLILLSVAMIGLKGLGFIQSNLFTNNFFWMASIIETLLLSIALAARYKRWQYEKNEANVKLHFQQMDMDRIAADNVKRIEFKNDLINGLKKVIRADDNVKGALQTLIFDYEHQLTTEKKQDFLNSNSNTINAEFKEKLSSKHPALTDSEIEICGYILIGLTNNEIAIFRSSNSIAIKSARYRIGKKMNLKKGQTISEALKSLSKKDF